MEKQRGESGFCVKKIIVVRSRRALEPPRIRLQVTFFLGQALCNTAYVIIYRYVSFGGLTPYYLGVTFILIIPVTAGAVLSSSRTFDQGTGIGSAFKNTMFAFNSVLFAFFISLREVLCRYKVQAQCELNQRPLRTTVQAYALTGPVLCVFICKVHLGYQAVALSLFLAWFMCVTSMYDPHAGNANSFYVMGGFYACLLYIGRLHNRQDYTLWQQCTTLKLQYEELSELRQRQGNLEKANQGFVNYMFHEMRNPLNNAVLALEVMKGETEEISQVVRRLVSMKHIMEEAVDYATSSCRLDDHEPVVNEINVIQLCGAAMKSMMSEFVDAQLRLSVECDQKIRRELVLLDDGRLRQFLLVVFRFALRRRNAYRLTVDPLTVFFERQLHVLTIDVSDHGPLLRQASLAITHNEDSQKEMVVGDGLTLTLMTNLIKAMGGSLTVDPDAETMKLSVTVPCVTSGELPFDPPDEHPVDMVVGTSVYDLDEQRLMKLNVLIVDDDALTRKLMRKMLSKLTSGVIDEAVNGLHCLEKLQGGYFEILFIDNQMPVMNGPETLQRLKDLSGILRLL